MTPIPSLEEAVARIIARAGGHDPDQSTRLFTDEGTVPGPFWMVFIEDAQAALQAIHDEGYVVVPRKMSEAQYDGLSNHGKLWRDMTSTEVYEVLIQAHLDTVGSGSSLRSSEDEARPPFAALPTSETGEGG